MMPAIAKMAAMIPPAIAPLLEAPVCATAAADEVTAASAVVRVTDVVTGGVYGAVFTGFDFVVVGVVEVDDEVVVVTVVVEVDVPLDDVGVDDVEVVVEVVVGLVAVWVFVPIPGNTTSVAAVPKISENDGGCLVSHSFGGFLRSNAGFEVSGNFDWYLFLIRFAARR